MLASASDIGNWIVVTQITATDGSARGSIGVNWITATVEEEGRIFCGATWTIAQRGFLVEMSLMMETGFCKYVKLSIQL
jgi:hypothetical protein